MQRDTIWSKVTQQIKKTWKRSNTKRPDTPEIPLHNYENAVSNSFPQRIGIETREDEWNRFWWQKEREREREREREAGVLNSVTGRWRTVINETSALCRRTVLLLCYAQTSPTRHPLACSTMSIPWRGLSSLAAPACNFRIFFIWIGSCVIYIYKQSFSYYRKYKKKKKNFFFVFFKLND